MVTETKVQRETRESKERDDILEILEKLRSNKDNYTRIVLLASDNKEAKIFSYKFNTMGEVAKALFSAQMVVMGLDNAE